ncbi:MAG: hypothetical protein Q8L45_01635 [Xanthomonadaceae bacterium]|nr:hypothetical protein [Xanthomonadaceae bacterium]MDP2185038.1 hypothetical protein [Xanthomonadales bacterium]MDZ4114417.1 hypothetical protein [Xanthomonadaceae bacterium]
MPWMPNDVRPTPPRDRSTAPWLRVLTCVTCMLVLTSCAHGTLATRATIPPEVLALLHPIPPTPMPAAQCLPLPPATDDSIPTLLRNHGVVSALYHQCAGRAESLQRLLTERERIEAERIARAAAALKGGSE